MNKNELRIKVLEKRKDLTKEELKEKGKLVKEKLFSLDEYKKAKTIMFFVSFGKELDTHNMIKETDKITLAPKIIDFEMFSCKIKDFNEMKRGSYSILEPITCEKFDKNKIDIVIVPGAAFDKNGYRIGYGKGYYDKFLKKFNGLKIGLCMDSQLIDNIPNDDWDIPMDIIITEKHIIRV